MIPKNGSGPVVLLVDDDRDLLELTQTILERNGMQVITALDGRRALAGLDLIQPDVMVTDMMMPVLDGLSLLRECARREPPCPRVIAVSSFAPYLEEARALGAVRTVSKPYDPRVLVEVIRQVVSGTAGARSLEAPMALQDERRRLRAMLEVRLEEPSPELGMRRFLDEVADTFEVPVAGISAVTQDRQRLVATCSAAAPDPGGPRESSFCTHAVAARSALVIQDATDNPYFRDNPSVTERGFQFYAGVPLMAPHGEAIGTLCVLDFKPHRFSYLDLELLSVLSRRVLAGLERRDRRTHPDTPSSAYQFIHYVDEELAIYGRGLFFEITVLEASRGIERDEPVALVGVALSHDRLGSAVAALQAALPGAFLGRLGTGRVGLVLRGLSAQEASDRVASCLDHAGDVVSAELTRYVGATGLALLHVEQALPET